MAEKIEYQVGVASVSTASTCVASTAIGNAGAVSVRTASTGTVDASAGVKEVQNAPYEQMFDCSSRGSLCENRATLYEPAFEHDACGIGAVVNIDGRKTHDCVSDALSIVEKLEHRAGKDAAGETGDGVGVILQIPHEYFAEVLAEEGLLGDGAGAVSGRDLGVCGASAKGATRESASVANSAHKCSSANARVNSANIRSSANAKAGIATTNDANTNGTTANCTITNSVFPAPGDVGVGMLFFPTDARVREQNMHLLEVILKKRGVRLICWREVPVNPDVLGKRARDCMPAIWQVFVERPADCEQGLDFDRLLFMVRREFEQSASKGEGCVSNTEGNAKIAASASVPQPTYVASFSSRTIVYKGMFLVGQLRKFYPDLQDVHTKSAIAMVHSRFSTNTNPSWQRAHPNRVLLHNGEINTIRGNIDRMQAREETMSTTSFGDNMDCVMPVVNASGSDSAMLDNALEFLMFSGVELPKAVMMLVPEPWSKNPNISLPRRDMYHYWATMMEPWDGPAALLFTDGEVMGAALDRNGLRPTRYYVTDDNRLILSSEVGVLDISDEHVIKKSRLEPGRMLVVDTREGKLRDDNDVKETYAAEHPYGEWLDCNLVCLEDLPAPTRGVANFSPDELKQMYKAFGYTYEDIYKVILPMANTGVEPTAAMGIDTPLAVLDRQNRPLFDYFKQMFAQVTNPPIDSMREEIVVDTTVYVGSDGNLLEDVADNCGLLQIDSPILTQVELEKIKALNTPKLKAETISLMYYKNTPFDVALERLFLTIEKAYHAGANIMVLTDRGVDENHVPIPSLLAVSAVEQYLVRTKKRTAISVVLESAEPVTVHHFATLLGYGARAVCPYLAHQCIRALVWDGALDRDRYVAIRAYNNAVLQGVVKVAAKMGISALQSYQSAQIFEIVGLSEEVVQAYFTNTVSRVGGIGLEQIAALVNERHNAAFDPMGLGSPDSVCTAGSHKMRSSVSGEDHLINPLTILLLQKSAREGDYDSFKKYSALVDDAAVPHTLRGLLEFARGGGDVRDVAGDVKPVPLDEVEPASEIVKRFKTGAMSYGSISQEAHECLAIAMNRLGGKSNSGEGGEVPDRLHSERGSAIKQVASGRFGVTSEYLVSADEIQIKMAQGAKPGEGGHLPGGKVWPWIAKTRYSTPGVSLISPPPHHDIYSIEDLAELIYDLKNANKHATIAVKLVSEAGVGTIAAGVAKAGAATVLVSGYDGGTGAAPRSSISGAGLPWELGVAEVHQTLIQNDLRTHVRIEADGKLMTGRDVVIAAMLGAEEFGFATAPLIAMGCNMMRVCNLDTCPVGIATQNPELRKNFKGKPEDVENFMMFIAEEVREILASLGLRTLDEAVGRTDLLCMRKQQKGSRESMVDVSRILGHSSDGMVLQGDADSQDGASLQEGADSLNDANKCSAYTSANPNHVLFNPADAYDFKLETTLDEKKLMPLLDVKVDASKTDTKVDSSTPAPQSLKNVKITSTDRAVGTLFGAELTRRFGTELLADTFHIHFKGGAGQSFGAFIPAGLALELEGDANDYFGKGLSGGTLIAYQPRKSKRAAQDNVIVGNVSLYGATSGKAFISGVAGERFCVRNSGATAVVEGVGDHGCEYMTGGTVVILGKTGRNFAAGMSGGVAYVYDKSHTLYQRTNKHLVAIETLTETEDERLLQDLLHQHVEFTGSKIATEMFEDFDKYKADFKKVIPHAYKHMTELIAKNIQAGLSADDAATKAFLERDAQ